MAKKTKVSQKQVEEENEILSTNTLPKNNLNPSEIKKEAEILFVKIYIIIYFVIFKTVWGFILYSGYLR